MDAEGYINIATMTKSGITVVSPDRELVEFVANPEDPGTTNITWGGENLTTAYVTSSSTGRLLTARWPRPGAAPELQHLKAPVALRFDRPLR